MGQYRESYLEHDKRFKQRRIEKLQECSDHLKECSFKLDVGLDTELIKKINTIRDLIDVRIYRIADDLSIPF